MIASLRSPDQGGVSDARLAVFRERFGELDDETFLAACEYAIDNDDFFPTVRRFREIVATLDVQTGKRLDGAAAWEAFYRRVLRPYSPGITKAFDWPDDLTRTIVREMLGGVHDIAGITSEYQRDKLRDRFITAYDRAGAGTEATERAQLATGSAPRLGTFDECGDTSTPQTLTSGETDVPGRGEAEATQDEDDPDELPY